MPRKDLDPPKFFHSQTQGTINYNNTKVLGGYIFFVLVAFYWASLLLLTYLTLYVRSNNSGHSAAIFFMFVWNIEQTIHSHCIY